MNENENNFYVTGLMDLSKYQLVRANFDEKWDKFVALSEQGTIFSCSHFLQAFSVRHGLWYCLKNEQLAAAIAVIESEDGASCKTIGHVIHNGIMFAPPAQKQNWAQTTSERFRITSAIIKRFTQHYEAIDFVNHPSVTDMRPFQWHNYHNDGTKFGIDIRYTSYLPLDSPEVIHDLKQSRLYLGCNTSRRQEIRYALEEKLCTKNVVCINEFLDLYKMTSSRQNITIPHEEITIIDNILNNLSQHGHLRMFSVYTNSGLLGSAAVFAVDKKRAYYLYGANNPELREDHCGTFVLWDAFKFLAEEGVTEVDLEGINSPKRGYFKLSFGGSITPYYRVYWNRV